MDREQWPLGSKFPPWDVSSKVIISALSLSGQCKANTPRSVGCIDSVCQWPNAVASPDQDERSGHLSWAQYYFILFLGNKWHMPGPPLMRNGYLCVISWLRILTLSLCLMWVSSSLGIRGVNKILRGAGIMLGNTFICSILRVLMMYGNTPIGYLIIPPFTHFRDMNDSCDSKGLQGILGLCRIPFPIESALTASF